MGWRAIPTRRWRACGRRSVSPGNSSLIMSQSGAKGNILNLAQTAALVGQQALRG
ncbi:MAG: hypothetical protein KKB67_09840, partial [Alphaproteobacteria bacterium]|nr:hypothetical protein [Alphaproteobacteria bacterium]